MILDPTSRFIHQITSHCDLDGATLLEIGCGRGRITADLAGHARRVVAIDPDAAALATARQTIPASHVEFICTSDHHLDLPTASFDFAIYSLSLHHIPISAMSESLSQAGTLLKPGGSMIVIEPGDKGSLIEAEERFGVGCGDERQAKAAALQAIHGLSDWHIARLVCFQTLFHFDDELDFLTNLQPDYLGKSGKWRQEVSRFLAGYQEAQQITLEAERRMWILTRHPASISDQAPGVLRKQATRVD
jgi:SAM-dependent methyltransferase